MHFLQLMLLEFILLLAAGIIFFGGIRGTVMATLLLTLLNLIVNRAGQFWRWEPLLLIMGLAGVILEMVFGRLARRSQVVSSLVGGFISLVLFGAFITPIAALMLWVLIIGMGIVPKAKKSQFLWSFAPTVLRFILGLVWIIYGNILTS